MLQHADEARVRVAAFIFIVDILQELVALLGFDSEQYRVDLGFHPIVALLGLRRAHVQQNGKACGTCHSNCRNSDCQFSSVSRIICTVLAPTSAGC